MGVASSFLGEHLTVCNLWDEFGVGWVWLLNVFFVVDTMYVCNCVVVWVQYHTFTCVLMSICSHLMCNTGRAFIAKASWIYYYVSIHIQYLVGHSINMYIV